MKREIRFNSSCQLTTKPFIHVILWCPLDSGGLLVCDDNFCFNRKFSLFSVDLVTSSLEPENNSNNKVTLGVKVAQRSPCEYHYLFIDLVSSCFSTDISSLI